MRALFLLAITLLGSGYAFAVGQGEETIPFTPAEYQRMRGASELTRNGIRRKTEEFIKNDERLDQIRASLKSSEERSFFDRGLIRSAQINQEKMTAFRDDTRMMQIAEEDGLLMNCFTLLWSDRGLIAFMHAHRADSIDRRAFTLFADRVYANKVFKATSPTRAECLRK